VSDTEERPPTCAECGREPRDAEAPHDEWRAYLDLDDELPVFCPECAEREFDGGMPRRLVRWWGRP
jgi:hypothetical protein